MAVPLVAITTPGQVDIHQAIGRYARPSATMPPQDGVAHLPHAVVIPIPNEPFAWLLTRYSPPYLAPIAGASEMDGTGLYLTMSPRCRYIAISAGGSKPMPWPTA